MNAITKLPDLKWGQRMLPPTRRSTETVAVETQLAGKWLVSAGRTGVRGLGRLFEIFIPSGKSGSDTNIMALELAIVTSIALQFGAPEEVLRNAMPRDEQGNPQGVLGAFLDQLKLRDMADGKKVEP